MLLDVSLALAGITSININPDLDEKDKQKILEKCDMLISDIKLKKSLPEQITFYSMKDILYRADNMKGTMVSKKSGVNGIQKKNLAAITFE